MHTYKIRAYRSRSEADTGRVMPQYVCSTGDYANATLTAKDFVDEYGAAVVENTKTGNRIWHVRPPQQSKALRLAELIQSRYGNDINDEAATELRRLSTVNAELLKALNLANQFITNGIGFGFIRLPDETQDTAHKTQSIVRAAIELATQED